MLSDWIIVVAVCCTVKWPCSTVFGGQCPGGSSPLTGPNNQSVTCQNDQTCGQVSHYCHTASGLCCPWCAAGGAPLPGTDSKPITCQTDQCCDSNAHYCTKSPMKQDENICCPQCPNGSPPLMGQDNKLLLCETDDCCNNADYYCHAVYVIGKPNVCCPRETARLPASPSAPSAPSTGGYETPTSTAGYGGQPTTAGYPVQTSTGGYAPAPSTGGYAPAPSTGGGYPVPVPTTAGYGAPPSTGQLTWQSMFASYKQQNASFTIPDASTFRANMGPAVPTTGQFKPCAKNADCYSSREPSEWCNSMPKYNWVGEGCVCIKDVQQPSCIIAREEATTKRKEWTFCLPENQFKCL